MNILLKNMDTVTSIEQKMFIKGANIGIGSGKILFVTDDGTIPDDFRPDKTIDGCHRLAMPGLVNAHTHCGMTLLRNLADDLPLKKWLFDAIFPLEEKMSGEDIYWGTMLGIAEMLKSGTTSFADMYMQMDYVAKAVCETGIRANLCRNPLDFRFGSKFEVVDATEQCRSYYKTWHGKAEGRVKVYVEIHSTYLFNRKSLEDAALLAAELETGIHTHLLETAGEREECLKNYGMSPVEVCAETGIFNVPVLAAHCVHLSDTDMKILNSKMINIAHNPTSNLKLGSGIARIPEMNAAGLDVAIGTDGAASNNNLNMFEELQLTALIHKGVHMNPEIMDAGQVIRMAAANGATAIGFGDAAGTIREGMRADIIIIDADKPHFCPVNDPLSAIVYTAQAADVDTVIVDGNVLMENRELKTIDEERVKYMAKHTAARIINS